MNKKAYEILKRPLITEKSTTEKDKGNKLVFEVDRRANKIEIKASCRTDVQGQCSGCHHDEYEGEEEARWPFFHQAFRLEESYGHHQAGPAR